MSTSATDIDDERSGSALTAIVERVFDREITDQSSYDLCSRCALVLKVGQLTTHLSACSGVT